MVKKLLVLMAASAIVSLVCFTVLNMMGGFGAINRGPMGNWGPWADWGDRRGDGRNNPGPEITRDLAYAGSDQLSIGYPAEITVTQGPQARFTVTGPQYILDQPRWPQPSHITVPFSRRSWSRMYCGPVTVKRA